MLSMNSFHEEIENKSKYAAEKMAEQFSKLKSNPKVGRVRPTPQDGTPQPSLVGEILQYKQTGVCMFFLYILQHDTMNSTVGSIITRPMSLMETLDSSDAKRKELNYVCFACHLFFFCISFCNRDLLKDTPVL